MATKTKAPDSKVDVLRRQNCLNPNPENVTDPTFQDAGFFDARDLVQVKYEMLRRVRVDGKPITESVQAFGLSRPTFYEAQSAFDQGGMAALLPKKRGPRRSHKLSAEVVAFLEQRLAEDSTTRPAALAESVRQRFGREVHPRSIERALEREKKKRQRPGAT